MSIDDAKKRASGVRSQNNIRRSAGNFIDIEFNNISFKGKNLSRRKFSGCKFAGCTLSNVEFVNTVFENCSFVNCEIDNSNFSGAVFDKSVSFVNCGLQSAAFNFAKGGFLCRYSIMSRSSALESNLKITLSDTDAAYFKANGANIGLDVVNSCLHSAEFCDSTVKGAVSGTDLTRCKFNRADMSQLDICNCPQNDMETDGAAVFYKLASGYQSYCRNFDEE